MQGGMLISVDNLARNDLAGSGRLSYYGKLLTLSELFSRY